MASPHNTGELELAPINLTGVHNSCYLLGHPKRRSMQEGAALEIRQCASEGRTDGRTNRQTDRRAE